MGIYGANGFRANGPGIYGAKGICGANGGICEPLSRALPQNPNTMRGVKPHMGTKVCAAFDAKQKFRDCV